MFAKLIIFFLEKLMPKYTVGRISKEVADERIGYAVDIAIEDGSITVLRLNNNRGIIIKSSLFQIGIILLKKQNEISEWFSRISYPIRRTFDKPRLWLSEKMGMGIALIGRLHTFLSDPVDFMMRRKTAFIETMIRYQMVSYGRNLYEVRIPSSIVDSVKRISIRGNFVLSSLEDAQKLWELINAPTEHENEEISENYIGFRESDNDCHTNCEIEVYVPTWDIPGFTDDNGNHYHSYYDQGVGSGNEVFRTRDLSREIYTLTVSK